MSVQDTGIGIRKEDQPLLFGNFSQLDTKKNRNVEGTGLGLAISKKLVELMDGSISVESVYGEGSTFSFDIIQGVDTPEPVIVLPETSHRKVVIWMDNPLKAQTLKNKIEAMGVTADITDNADNFCDYSHAFFDYGKFSAVDAKKCTQTKLVALTRNYNNRSLPGQVITIYTPLTSAVVAEILSEKSFLSFDAEEAVAPETGLAFENTNVLVVDDNDINLLIAENVLLTYCDKVTLAKSGEEALALVKAHEYDIVFMDHMMPVMDGVDATVLIREMPEQRCKTMPIVALTANAVGDVREMFLSHGMNDFLSKPLEIKEIERVLREWMPPEKRRRVSGNHAEA